MYEVNYTRHAYKQLSKLPKETAERIISALDRAKIRPEHHFERLVGEELYKLRVGDYRVIAEIIRAELRILVIEVDHRKRIYKH